MQYAHHSGPFEPGELERVLQRFDWLADEVRDDVHRSDAFELQEVLGDPTARVSAKERALVRLGLLGSADAYAVLKWFDADGEHRRVRLLSRMARRECARRRQRPAGGDVRRRLVSRERVA